MTQLCKLLQCLHLAHALAEPPARVVLFELFANVEDCAALLSSDPRVLQHLSHREAASRVDNKQVANELLGCTWGEQLCVSMCV